MFDGMRANLKYWSHYKVHAVSSCNKMTGQLIYNSFWNILCLLNPGEYKIQPYGHLEQPVAKDNLLWVSIE